MKSSNASLRLLFLSALTILGFIFLGVPLLPSTNDAAWYYMNVHYIYTGEYIYEHVYPSFVGPSQLYPLGGYSLFILLSKMVETFTGVSWLGTLKLIQFLAYGVSAYLVFKIGVSLKYFWAAPASTCLFFLYFPFFNYASFVMSENIAVMLILFFSWLCLKGLSSDNKSYLFFSLVLAGYAILLKPVLILTGPLLIGVIFFYRRAKAGVGFYLILLLLFFTAPLLQSLTNRYVYGNFSIRSGSGWNLWNRVIFYDKSYPRKSPEFYRLMKSVMDKGENVTTKLLGWWDAVSFLSRQGYSERETQLICGKVALAGIRENKWKYLKNTFRLSRLLLLAPPTFRYVFPPDYSNYFDYLHEYDLKDKQHGPLTRELLPQEKTYPLRYLANVPLWLYYAFCRLFQRLTSFWFHPAMLWGYLLWGAFLGWKICKTRQPDALRALLIFILPLLIVVGSSLTEALDFRFKIPAMPFIIMGCCYAAEDIVSYYKNI